MNIIEALRLVSNTNVRVRPRCWRDPDSLCYKKGEWSVYSFKNGFGLSEKIGKVWVACGPLAISKFEEFFDEWEIIRDDTK